MLKFQYDTKELIPQGMEKEYIEKDGKFVLQVDGAPTAGDGGDGGGDSEAKKKLKEFRDRNIELQKQFDAQAEKFKDVDPEAYRKLQEEKKKFEEQKMIEAGQFQELIANTKKESAAQIQAMDQIIADKTRELDDKYIADAVRVRIPKVGNLRDPALETYILADAIKAFKRENGQIVRLSGHDGQPSLNSEGKPETLSDWLKSSAEGPHAAMYGASEGGNATGGSGFNPAAGTIRLDEQTINQATFDALASGALNAVD